MNQKPVFCNMTPDIERKAEKELGETKSVKNHSIKELKKLIKEESNFEPDMDEAFLLRYLRARKFNVRKSFALLKAYYQYKARYSRIITDFTPSDLKEVLSQGQMVLIEYRNTDDTSIGIIRPGHYDINKFKPMDLGPLAFLFGEIGLTSEVSQIAGYCVIIDMAGFNLRVTKHYFAPVFLYRLITAVQSCVPARIKGIHIMNEPSYVDAFYAIAKRFLGDKVRNRVIFHGNNLKSLHKHITPDVLPEEYGGTYGSLSETAERCISLVLGFEDHFIRINKFGYVGQTLKKLREEVSDSERKY